MAEGILCNCLEATSTQQSRLQYLSSYYACAYTHAHVVVTPLHKPCRQHQFTLRTSIVA